MEQKCSIGVANQLKINDEKALDCKDAIDELTESLSECYKVAFDNVVAEYDGILAIIEHEKSILEERISQVEAKGYIVSTKYYEALINQEKNNIDELEEEREKLISKFNEAVNVGAIEKYSEAWYEMCQEIDDVTLAIEESKTAMLEYANSIQEIEWDVFDLLQEQISNVTKEADFLIDLMSHDKLHDNKGQLTNEGMSTMGLHGQNYNTYMYQADKYAKEMREIDKKISKDPYNQVLIERRQELLELQRENILAAEDEKQAIISLVEEGINLELEALQELIDEYTKALDAEKDLYDYSKKIEEQVKVITDIEKQLGAYASDDSEENKARIQQLKNDLESAKEDLQESEYDRYISDQKKLLDDLYLEYETILNARLDNIDQLLLDMILEINTNSVMIGETLSIKADEVGYRLSDSMTSIWATNISEIKTVITSYGDNFTGALTTTNSTLNSMNVNLQSMIGYLSSIASAATSQSSSSSATYPSLDDSTSSDSSSRYDDDDDGVASYGGGSGGGSSSPKKDTSVSKGDTITVDSSAPIFDWAGDDTGEGQYFRNDPVYKVLKEEGDRVQVQWHGVNSGVTGWINKSDIVSSDNNKKKSYAKGKRDFLSDEIAWTQEQGSEFIVRPSDGAILTPIAKGDSVLNNFATNNIWDMANNPVDFIKDNLQLDNISTPNVQSNQNSYSQSFENITFSLPNVKNYDELLVAMKQDKNFERLIMAMTIDGVAGKSSLAKGKSIRY